MPIEVKQHLDKLHTFLKSDDLHIEGRLFILLEIWDIKDENSRLGKGD